MKPGFAQAPSVLTYDLAELRMIRNASEKLNPKLNFFPDI